MGDAQEEEQEMEREALEAILMDDLEVLSGISPRKYRIKVLPYPNGEGENHVSIHAIFLIPGTYPDVRAEVEIEPEKGLSTSQCDNLKQLILSKAEENVGMAMVYTLVDVIREWLIENNFAGQDGSMHAEMLKRMQMKEKEKQKEVEAIALKARAAGKGGSEEEDELLRQKRLEGTPVTPESFSEWRDRFDDEMNQKDKSSGVGTALSAINSEKKLTGKEMFLCHVAGTTEEEEDDEGGVQVNDALFDDDDEDDDDSDFELDSEEEEDGSEEEESDDER